MKKVLIITHSISGGGGAEKILNLMLKFINKEKYEIDVLEIKNANKTPPLYKGINYLGYIRIRNNKLIDKIKDKIYLFLLVFFPNIVYKKFIKKKYDVKISFNYLIPSFLINALNDDSKKICWIHSSIEDLNYSQYKNYLKKIEYKILNKFQKKVFEKANKIIPISKTTKDSIEKLYPFTIPKLKIIYNGFDFKEYKINESITKENYIVVVGRLEKRKNFTLAIDVLNELVKKRKINIKLKILGEGELREKLENKVKKLRLEKEIQFMGYVQDPKSIVAQAKLLLVTSFVEGFPTVIVESLALKTPVVSTPVAGTEELLVFNSLKCGEITNYTVKDIADKIENLLKNRELYHIYQELGYKNVKKFTIDSQLSELEKIID